MLLMLERLGVLLMVFLGVLTARNSLLCGVRGKLPCDRDAGLAGLVPLHGEATADIIGGLCCMSAGGVRLLAAKLGYGALPALPPSDMYDGWHGAAIDAVPLSPLLPELLLNAG